MKPKLKKLENLNNTHKRKTKKNEWKSVAKAKILQVALTTLLLKKTAAELVLTFNQPSYHPIGYPSIAGKIGVPWWIHPWPEYNAFIFRDVNDIVIAKTDNSGFTNIKMGFPLGNFGEETRYSILISSSNRIITTDILGQISMVEYNPSANTLSQVYHVTGAATKFIDLQFASSTSTQWILGVGKDQKYGVIDSTVTGGSDPSTVLYTSNFNTADYEFDFLLVYPSVNKMIAAANQGGVVRCDISLGSSPSISYDLNYDLSNNLRFFQKVVDTIYYITNVEQANVLRLYDVTLPISTHRKAQVDITSWLGISSLLSVSKDHILVIDVNGKESFYGLPNFNFIKDMATGDFSATARPKMNRGDRLVVFGQTKRWLYAIFEDPAIGTYFTAKIQNLACHSRCATCVGIEENSCVTCPSGFELASTNSYDYCQASCPPGQYLSPTDRYSCFENCQARQYRTPGGVTCSNCATGCASCSDASTCTTCLDDYFMIPSNSSCHACWTNTHHKGCEFTRLGFEMDSRITTGFNIEANAKIMITINGPSRCLEIVKERAETLDWKKFFHFEKYTSGVKGCEDIAYDYHDENKTLEVSFKECSDQVGVRLSPTDLSIFSNSSGTYLTFNYSQTEQQKDFIIPSNQPAPRERLSDRATTATKAAGATISVGIIASLIINPYLIGFLGNLLQMVDLIASFNLINVTYPKNLQLFFDFVLNIFFAPKISIFKAVFRGEKPEIRWSTQKSGNLSQEYNGKLTLENYGLTALVYFLLMTFEWLIRSCCTSANIFYKISLIAREFLFSYAFFEIYMNMLIDRRREAEVLRQGKVGTKILYLMSQTILAFQIFIHIQSYVFIRNYHYEERKKLSFKTNATVAMVAARFKINMRRRRMSAKKKKNKNGLLSLFRMSVKPLENGEPADQKEVQDSMAHLKSSGFTTRMNKLPQRDDSDNVSLSGRSRGSNQSTNSGKAKAKYHKKASKFSAFRKFVMERNEKAQGDSTQNDNQKGKKGYGAVRLSGSSTSLEGNFSNQRADNSSPKGGHKLSKTKFAKTSIRISQNGEKSGMIHASKTTGGGRVKNLEKRFPNLMKLAGEAEAPSPGLSKNNSGGSRRVSIFTNNSKESEDSKRVAADQRNEVLKQIRKRRADRKLSVKKRRQAMIDRLSDLEVFLFEQKEMAYIVNKDNFTQTDFPWIYHYYLPLEVFRYIVLQTIICVTQNLQETHNILISVSQVLFFVFMLVGALKYKFMYDRFLLALYVFQEFAVTIFIFLFVALEPLQRGSEKKGAIGVVCLSLSLFLEMMIIMKKVCFSKKKKVQKRAIKRGTFGGRRRKKMRNVVQSFTRGGRAEGRRAVGPMRGRRRMIIHRNDDDDDHDQAEISISIKSKRSSKGASRRGSSRSIKKKPRLRDEMFKEAIMERKPEDESSPAQNLISNRQNNIKMRPLAAAVQKVRLNGGASPENQAPFSTVPDSRNDKIDFLSYSQSPNRFNKRSVFRKKSKIDLRERIFMNRQLREKQDLNKSLDLRRKPQGVSGKSSSEEEKDFDLSILKSPGDHARGGSMSRRRGKRNNSKMSLREQILRNKAGMYGEDYSGRRSRKNSSPVQMRGLQEGEGRVSPGFDFEEVETHSKKDSDNNTGGVDEDLDKEDMVIIRSGSVGPRELQKEFDLNPPGKRKMRSLKIGLRNSDFSGTPAGFVSPAKSRISLWSQKNAPNSDRSSRKQAKEISLFDRRSYGVGESINEKEEGEDDEDWLDLQN